MVEAVVSRGVTPAETEIFGVTVPENKILAEPVVDTPIAACVIVAEPDVQAAKVTLVDGLTELLVTVQPVAVRLTATLVYAPYAVSLVAIVPASPGSAVCRDTANVVSGAVVALIAMLAIELALKIRVANSFSNVFPIVIGLIPSLSPVPNGRSVFPFLLLLVFVL
jgi:hypothetical protein